MNKSFYLVVGLGKTGLSIARYLKRRNLAFFMYDTRENPAGAAEFSQTFPDVPLYLNQIPEALFPKLIAVISSPGIALDIDLFKQARSMGVPVYGDIECLAKEITAPIIAITGTNGKSTVTSLVGEMAKAAGFNVAVAGNIGLPVLDLLDDGQSYDLWVLELSSFQLELTQSLSPVASTILNISSDHLDRHQSIEQYIAVKQSIYKGANKVVFNREDINTKPELNSNLNILPVEVTFGSDVPKDCHWGITTVANETFLTFGSQQLLAVDKMPIKGVHNWQNALAACALAYSVGISFEIMAQVLESFAGLSHRCQWVKTIDEIDWINDSKGTNIGATVSAISGIGGTIQGKIVLIAGGQGKGADFRELEASVARYVRAAVLIGEDADKIEQVLGAILPVKRAASLDEAVDCAKAMAKPGDAVLMSPACASLDMFKDFNHRGEVFTSLVNQL